MFGMCQGNVRVMLCIIKRKDCKDNTTKVLFQGIFFFEKDTTGPVEKKEHSLATDHITSHPSTMVPTYRASRAHPLSHKAMAGQAEITEREQEIS